MSSKPAAAHLDKPKHWQPLVYCWRGGKRSNSLALILGQIGFKVTLIEGGYKAFRKAIISDTHRRSEDLKWRVLCGPTGSGKTRLLHALAAQGAQTLDLEAQACHRASVLGLIPGQAQPSQKAFETRLWDALRKLTAAQPVYVEAESKKVGKLTVPTGLMDAIRVSPCIRLESSLQARVALLLQDYPHFVQSPELFCERLDRLVDLRGKATIQRWQDGVRTGQIAAVVAELLQKHYDPGYEASTRRNFHLYERALNVTLESTDSEHLENASKKLLNPQEEQTP